MLKGGAQITVSSDSAPVLPNDDEQACRAIDRFHILL
jgi:hypothetical protein